MGTRPLTPSAPLPSWHYEACWSLSLRVPPSQYPHTHWSSWPGPYSMLNLRRFFSILPDGTEPILLPGGASLGPPKLPALAAFL